MTSNIAIFLRERRNKMRSAVFFHRQILPKPYQKILLIRPVSRAFKPPFNDSTRLSGGLSRDYYTDVAFV